MFATLSLTTGIVLSVPSPYVLAFHHLAAYLLMSCMPQFAHDDKTVFFTAEDIARIKIFSLPVPPTPDSSTVDPEFSEEFRKPRELTSTGAVTEIQPLSDGRLVFTRSSLTSPNDVFIIRGLNESGKPTVDQLTKFSTEGLKGKSLDSGEDFWFEGAEGKKIHGWAIKPPGFKKGEKKQWPILLAIHGGTIRVDTC